MPRLSRLLFHHFCHPLVPGFTYVTSYWSNGEKQQHPSTDNIHPLPYCFRVKMKLAPHFSSSKPPTLILLSQSRSKLRIWVCGGNLWSSPTQEWGENPCLGTPLRSVCNRDIGLPEQHRYATGKALSGSKGSIPSRETWSYTTTYVRYVTICMFIFLCLVAFKNPSKRR